MIVASQKLTNKEKVKDQSVCVLVPPGTNGAEAPETAPNSRSQRVRLIKWTWTSNKNLICSNNSHSNQEGMSQIKCGLHFFPLLMKIKFVYVIFYDQWRTREQSEKQQSHKTAKIPKRGSFSDFFFLSLLFLILAIQSHQVTPCK